MARTRNPRWEGDCDPPPPISRDTIEVGPPPFFAEPVNPLLTQQQLARELGGWQLAKFSQQCADSGPRQAAKNMRKQGVPVALVLKMLRLLQAFNHKPIHTGAGDD